jgi:glycerol-3-phosphate acyltransferase PlsY
MIWVAVLLVAIAYLVGGIPVGFLLARAKGVNLLEVGSGNIGATNVVRALGLKWGLLAWLGDAAKGVAAVVLARVVGQPEAVLAATGISVVVGHCLSPYLRLRGGKGVATSLGVLLATDWRVGLLAFVVWIAVMLVSKIVSVASLCAAMSLVPLGQAVHDTPAYLVMTAVLTCIGFIRHHDNLERLFRGEEKPFARRPPSSGTVEKGVQ